MLVGSKYEAYKYPTGRERGFFSSSFLEVKVKGEGEQWKILVIEN